MAKVILMGSFSLQMGNADSHGVSEICCNMAIYKL